MDNTIGVKVNAPLIPLRVNNRVRESKKSSTKKKVKKLCQGKQDDWNNLFVFL
jgi:hypothetical protein